MSLGFLNEISAMDCRRWFDIPADMLREISDRVCDAAGFVYFHAVCKPWRASHDPLARSTSRTQFLPWLQAPPGKDLTQLRFRCIFSKSTYHAMSWLHPPAGAAPNLLGSTDGTKVRYLTVENLRPTLHNPLTGEFTHLPLLPYDMSWWEEENPQGIIYADGTTFLYSLWSVVSDSCTIRFRAALHHPGGTRWTVVHRTLRAPWRNDICAVVYRGKVMVTMDIKLWHIIALDGGNEVGDLLVHRPMRRWDYCSGEYNYVMESREVLLWVFVQVHFDYNTHFDGGAKLEISMSLNALEETATTQGKKMQWVKKDGCCVADRVLFLGTPSSFVIDSSRLGDNEGGCAYFVYNDCRASSYEKVGMYRCNLISNVVKFVEWLPQGWHDRRGTWYLPQHAISPIQELMKARKQKQTGTAADRSSSKSYTQHSQCETLRDLFQSEDA